jgi:prolyl oligopeptidase
MHPFIYPNARIQDLVEDFHGTPVADPYRWLEDPASPESRAWTDAQNTLTQKYLDHPSRSAFHGRMMELWNYARYTLPQKAGNRYFFWKNDGLQNQPVLYMQDSLEAEPVMVIDPNTFSREGTVAVMSLEFSKDGRYMAYSTATKGSDWQEIHIRDLETGQKFFEVLQHVKFSGIAWSPDNKGFYYNRYPDSDTVAPGEETYYNHVCWHEVGTDQSDDLLVYEHPEQKDWSLYPQLTEDGQYLFISLHSGTDRRNGLIWRREADRNAAFQPLRPLGEAAWRLIANQGTHCYFQTDADAPTGKVVIIDLEAPAQDKTLIPAGDEAIAFALRAADTLVVGYLHHAHHILKRFDLQGQYLGEISLPAMGAVNDLFGKPHLDELFIGFSSFLFPARSYRYDLATGAMTLLRAPEIAFDMEAYETTQVFVTSKDGTEVPMFLTMRKGLQPDGNNPVMMYGYGGFRNALTPHFSVSLLPWLEQGGIYAHVNLRGGSEYGTEWYQAGTLERKQNVFDDFIAAGEWLVAQQWTQPRYLAIRGGSNGGLLVAACMVQRPDLFGAVLCQVPVIDMLRYHRFTIGRYWISDYGNAENPDQFPYMYAYSPLHNVKAGAAYPPVLITTADHDDRVVPAHAKKFAATLQAANPQNLTLLRVETAAGHGAGKPLAKVTEEYADLYAFLFHVMQRAYQA